MITQYYYVHTLRSECGTMSRCMMFRIESAIVPINRRIPNIAMTAIIALSSFSNVTSKKNLLYLNHPRKRGNLTFFICCVAIHWRIERVWKWNGCINCSITDGVNIVMGSLKEVNEKVSPSFEHILLRTHTGNTSA